MKRKFTRWTDAVLFLNKKINNQQPLAGRNITLENTGSGIRIHSKASGVGGSSAYNGYFKVAKIDEKTVKIVNGANPESTIAGRINAGTTVDVNVKEFTITADCVVFVETTYDSESETLTATLKCQSELPQETNSPPTDIFHIADIFVISNNMTIGQIWQSGEYKITDRWL